MVRFALANLSRKMYMHNYVTRFRNVIAVLLKCLSNGIYSNWTNIIVPVASYNETANENRKYSAHVFTTYYMCTVIFVKKRVLLTVRFCHFHVC